MTGVLVMPLARAAVPAPRAGAQAAQGRRPSELAFTDTDFVRGTIEPGRRRFVVGEPVVLPIRVINHTRHLITIDTNFIPQSNLEIDIQPYDQRARAYNGPYPPGRRWPTASLKLFPHDQIEQNVVVWADLSQPGGLAFPEPGTYLLTINLMLGVPEANFTQRLPFDPVQVEIVPAPEALAPIVDRLRELEAFDELQMLRVPEGEADAIEQLLLGHKPNVMTPYLALALANYYTFAWSGDQENRELIRKVLDYYRSAAYSDNAYKFDAYEMMLRFLDTLEETEIAARIAEEMLAELPATRRGRVGEMPFLATEKRQRTNVRSLPELLGLYKVDTRELDPRLYWEVLP